MNSTTTSTDAPDNALVLMKLDKTTISLIIYFMVTIVASMLIAILYFMLVRVFLKKYRASKTDGSATSTPTISQQDVQQRSQTSGFTNDAFNHAASSRPPSYQGVANKPIDSSLDIEHSPPSYHEL
jgi:hypothetical protein